MVMLAKRIKPEELSNYDNGEWIAERKYDGTRILMTITKHKISMINRRDIEKIMQYPEFLNARECLNDDVDEIVLDGELIVNDDFNLLAKRDHLTDKMKIKLMSMKYPATYMVFDVLEVNGVDVRNRPLIERKRILRQFVRNTDNIKIVEYVENGFKEFFDWVINDGGEGIMLKKKSSPYLDCRSDLWLKVKKEETVDVKVLGYEEGDEHGALITELGKVSLKSKAFLTQYLELSNKHKEIFAEVKFMELSKNGKMRFPVLVRLRTDKR